MPDKKYLIEIPGMPEGSGVWDADKWERNKDLLMEDFPEANVFELGEYDAEDAQETDQIMLDLGNEEMSGVWDNAKWERNKDLVMEDYPEAKVSRVRYVDYWGQKAEANRTERAELLKPNEERNTRLAEIGYYDDISEGQVAYGADGQTPVGLKPLSSAIETNSVSGQTTYLDPKVKEFFANDSYETDRQAEISRLDAEYDANPSVIAYREWMAGEAERQAEERRQMRGEINTFLNEEIDHGKAGRAMAGKRTSSKYGMSPYIPTGEEITENERREKAMTALKLLEKADIVSDVKGKGFWAAAGDQAQNMALDAGTQSDIEAYNEIGDILTSLEEKLGNLKEENITPEVLEENLSTEDKMLIQSFFEYNSAMAAAQKDMSRAYKGGKIFAESVPFMLEFLVTGGVAAAGEAGVAGAARAAEKGIAKALVKWVTKKAAGKAARMAVARGVQKASTAVIKGLAATALRTVAGEGTYKRMAEASLEIDKDGHLNRAKNAAVSFADTYVENLSEISGGIIGETLGLLGKGAGWLIGKTPLSKIGGMLGDNVFMQGLSKFGNGVKAFMPKLEALGFHGLPEEVGEEFIGNAIREIAGIQPGALKEMVSDDNFGAMLIGFAPMTMLGVAGGIYNLGVVNAQAAKLGDSLREKFGSALSEEELDHMMGVIQNAQTAEEIQKALKPMAMAVVDSFEKGMISQEEMTEQIEMLYQYGGFMAQNNALLFGKKAQDRQMMDAKREEFTGQYGRFWQEDQSETVQTATLNNGSTVFVTSAPTEDGKITIIDVNTGKKGFANVSDIATREVDGEQIQSTNSMTMDAFLNGQIAMQRKTAEETRMNNERNAQIDALRAQITPGTRINLGTEGSPVYVFAKRTNKNGVVVVDETGMESTLGWEQAAYALGQPIKVETDQEKLDAEIAARLQRMAERRMTRAVTPATQATEEAAEGAAEVVAREQQNIPLNEDGTVNEALFWTQDPEGYVKWNDEQNKDGGQDSLKQIAISKQELFGMLQEAATGQNTSNPTMRKAAEKQVAAIAEKIARLEALEMSYADALAEEKEAVKQTAATPTATMSEEQLEQMDAQYQGILGKTRIQSERVRVMQEYLNKISEESFPVVVLTRANYAEKMKAEGCEESRIKTVERYVKLGKSIGGFTSNGKLFLMEEGLPNINEARVTYVHERQHVLNTQNPKFVQAIVEAAGGNREMLVEWVKSFVGNEMDAYKSLTSEGLADELICRCMEIAYTSEEFSVDLQSKGIPSEVISIITEIDNEQRSSTSLANARRRGRRNENANVNIEGGVEENGRDSGQVSGGILGNEAVGSSGSSNGGASVGSTGEGAEVIPEEGNVPFRIVGEPEEVNPAFVEAISTDVDEAEYAQFLDDKAFAQPQPVDGIQPDDVRFSIVLEDKMRGNTQAYFDKHYNGGTLGKKDQKLVPLNVTHFTQILLDAANAQIEEMRQYMLPYLDMESKGKRFLPAEVYGKSTLFDNSSYGKTMENTLICTRTLAYIDFVEEVKKRIGRPLTATESFLASQMLYDIAVDPQCLYCYVSLDRKAYDEFLLRYIQQRDEVISKWNASDKSAEAKEALYKEFLAGRKPTSQMQARFESWLLLSEGDNAITPADLATKARRGDLKIAEAPEAWEKARSKYQKLKGEKKLAYAASEEYQTALWNYLASPLGQVTDAEAYAQSASWAKKEEDYRSYTGELLNCTADALKGLMGHYGLRFYSFSEYSPAFILENMQMVRDAAARGLKGFAYTKEIDFIKIFAPTGMNINCSVYGRVDSEGNVVPDTKQGADWAQVQALREQYPNVGAVFVATNDEMVEWALNQPWIDVIIPFHIVRTGADIAKFYEWTNYSSMQADTTPSGKTTYVFPHEHHNDKTTFLKIAQERGLSPRFADVKLADGRSIVEHPNYMRLVNETRRSVDETPILTPTFNVEAAKESFDAFVAKGGYYSGYFYEDEAFEQGIETVVEDIKAGKTAKDVEYGRQDVPIDVAKIMAKRAEMERKHGKSGVIDLVEEAEVAAAKDVMFRFIGEIGARRMDAETEANYMMDNLDTARAMEQEGKDMKTIKMATGWERGADTMWRYEMEDFEFKGKPGKKKTFKLQDLIKDFALFAAYPELKDIKVQYKKLPKGVNGRVKHDSEGKVLSIELSENNYRAEHPEWKRIFTEFKEKHPEAAEAFENGTPTREHAEIFMTEVAPQIENLPQYIDEYGGKETLVHEIQHTIQRAEGFVKGGNVNMIDTSDPDNRQNILDMMQERDDLAAKVNELAARWNELKGLIAVRKFFRDDYADLAREQKDVHNEYMKVRAEYDKSNKALRGFDKLGYDNYKRLAGETEARNAARRINMPYQERRESLYTDTQDVRTEDQIFLRGNVMKTYDEMMATENVSFRVTPEQDKAYMDAVKAGDLETAQKMVIEAAKIAMPNTKVVDEEGNPLIVYHGTSADFNVFDENYSSTNTGAKNTTLGFYFTPLRSYAEKIAKGDSKVIKSVFLNIQNPLELGYAKKFDGSFHNGREAKPFNYEDSKNIVDGLAVIRDAVTKKFGSYTQENVSKWKSLVESYYDGIYVMTGDTADFTRTLIPSMQYIAFFPSQIKSADPVTYDNNGNVIPLSERFNPENADIRFRVLDTTNAELKDKPIKLNGMYRFNLKNAFKGVKDNGGSYPYIKVQLEEVPEDYSGEKITYNGILEGFAVVRVPKGLITEGEKDNVFFIDPKAIENELWDVLRATENYYEFKHGSAPYQRNWLNTEEVRFRVSNDNQAIFVSNAAKAVEGIKQDKATPEQWLKMIEKNGGLKAGEDKWMGLSDFLKSSDKKTLTKAEVLDFINENMIVIEEQHYSNEEMSKASVKILNIKYQGWEDAFSFEWDGYMEEPSADISDYEAAVELYNKHHDDKVALDEDGEFEDMDTYEKVRQFGVELSEIYHGSKSEVRPIDGTREQYTTRGLQHLHEIALTVPTIESWGLGGSNTVHFEDAGDGRAVAWIRFGETWEQRPSPQISRKVLVIDEIQSKRHQEGREKGYKTLTMEERAKGYRKLIDAHDELYESHEEKYGRPFELASSEEDYKEIMSPEDFDALNASRQALSDARLGMRALKHAVPDAPFDKNWHELAMKRMLRYAAENGYDVVAWTKGDQHAERYSIGGIVDDIYYSGMYPKSWDSEEKVRYVDINLRNGHIYHLGINENGFIEKEYNGEGAVLKDEYRSFKDKDLSDVVGKDVALQVMQMEEGTNLKAEDLKVGGEGMKGFYDRMLPAFMNKYGKKWGVKVEDIELPNLEEAGRVMHSIPVTEEMKTSVMEGQVMFRTAQNPLDAPLTAEERAKINEFFPGFSEINSDIRTSMNSLGQELTPGQQAFFANSKAVDKDGNLLVLYHGTPRAGFTEFTSGWFTTSKEDAVSYSGDRKGRLFDPNEKYEPETLTAGDFRLGYMTFDSEEDRAAFLERFPYADEVMSEREYEDARMGAEDEEYDALTARRNEFAEVWNAYREYERERFVDTTIGDLISNPEAYTEEDLMRAMLEYDSNASLDSLDDMSAEERKDALVSALQNANEETEGGILDMVVPTRVLRNGEGVKHNDLGNRTYEVYANIENPYEIDANGRGSEFESGDIYKAVEEGLADERYDGVIVRNWRVGRTQQLGDVVVPKDGSQIKLTSNENPTESSDIRFRTSLELDEEFGDAWRNQQNEDGRHSTQVANTKSTYEKIGRYLEDAGMKGASILDASSGLGLGTQALREMGFNVEDVEPFPSENREAPTYSSYADIEGQYDVVISNAVLNVIPDDWRADVLHQMADAVKEGGKMIINTRPASNIAQQGVEGKTRITLDSPSEILVKRGDRIAAYQKGFTSEELAEWIKSELGEGWRVEKATKKNSGISGEGTAVVIRESEDAPRFRTIGTPTDEVVANGLQLTPAQTADVAANIFAALPEESRKKLTEGLNGNILGLKDAILQIPASLAVKENWDEEDIKLANAVRTTMQDAIDKQQATSRPLTTKEALWMLYDSTNTVKDLVDAASRAFVAHSLGFDQTSMQRKAEVDDYLRFRTASGGAIDAATDMYNFETSLWTERLKESWLDMNQSVISLQKAMAEASGMPIEPWENLEFALNRLSSKSYADKKKYLRDFLMPMWDTILDIVKHDHVSIEEIERYMMLKHGLERNKKFASRDAKEFYRAMYDVVAERMKNQSHAEQVVALSEANKALADIRAKMANATGQKLAALQEAEKKAMMDVQIADLVLRGDEKQNEAELQAYYDAIDNEMDPKYREFREKDYGGLTSMFVDSTPVQRSNYKSEEAYQKAVLAATTPRYNDVAAMESAAEREVSLFENKVYMYRALWDKVNAATKETLRHQYESGMITREQYEAVRDMFEFYVPLRGFADNTAEDMYSYYMTNSAGGFTKPILAAKGRKTRAESPLGWIGTMAESAIQADNKNEAKMCLYYATLRRPDQNLLTITETWYEYTGQKDANGKKIFKPAYPPAVSQALSADDLRQHMDTWEADMKQKQSRGEAYKGSQVVDLRGSVVFQDAKEEKEHIVRVKVAGQDYSILINGNPRAAQAINGLLNPDANVGPVAQWIGNARRNLSALLTSYSPLFWVANFQRDLLSSVMRVSEADGWDTAMKYLANRRKAWRVASYIYKYDAGTLGDTYYEKLYKEFAENGGITGYTALTTNKEYENLLEKYANNVDKHLLNAVKGIWDKFMGFGEAIEQVSRFAAFITAREEGKSIEEAINAAKEVSVNFNRKGSAKPISLDELDKLRTKDGKKLNKAQRIAALTLSAMPGPMKFCYYFVNASIQALSSSVKLAKKSPGKATTWVGMYMGTSIALAMLNYLLSDDDDDEYLNLPDYLRHSTALVKVADGYYFKWSIPQEMRPFYAWADILVRKMMGKMPHKSGKEVGKEMALAASQWLPVNPFEAEDPLLSLVPDFFSPLAEIKANTNAFGGKIYDDMSFKSEGVVKEIPAYRKATEKTGDVYVDIAEFLNDVSGGDEVTKGKININPAIMEHLIEGYGGGIYDFAKMMVSIPSIVLSDDPLQVKEIPFVNKVILSVDETNMYSHTNEAFYHYKNIADNAKRVEKEYRESDNPSRADDYQKEEDWRIYLLYKEYERDFKDVKERLDNAVDKEEEDLLKQEQNVLREMFLDDIAKGDVPEVTFQIREDIKRIDKEVKAVMKPVTEANKERLERREAGDFDGMIEAIEKRDSLKDTPEYKKAEEISKDLKAIKKQLNELGSVSRGSQRDSVVGELQKNYDALVRKMQE